MSISAVWPQGLDFFGTPLVIELWRLAVGSSVLGYSQGRWRKAEIIARESDDHVRIHCPAWDSKRDVTVQRSILQVDLGGSVHRNNESGER
jgi:hypothetical protein